MYNFSAHTVKVILNLFGKIKVYNKEHFDIDGPFVVACTHTGWVDILWLGVTMLPRQIHYMAKKQLFTNKFIGGFLTKLNAFPVDRDNPGPSVLKIPSRLLSKGEIVGIFPSGTRKNEQTALKQGAITIAQRGKVPVVPAVYIGPNSFKDLFKRQKAKLIFGEPFYIAAEGMDAKEAREHFTNVLEQKFIQLEEELRRK
ncbi:lysophospholipid acyltransferase family protein [Ferdinandcohnia quinoae]|uniref:1-acyl-sn-glycerol-3-phosphate acyltransferase n=1 Tax=Fredinandcohnia quinoae TaxID=2918902 RepID=A0AAW5EAG8_9BACI|nr:lysophospholipid acyltransferase family protein [Fredinandcohnia sp. SECRCQ15]MCH1626872.1 1-acyl-sn-glycerol-3-phosphate acyltransferase [Fredinandcohnia sp. SECRCQ15]